MIEKNEIIQNIIKTPPFNSLASPYSTSLANNICEIFQILNNENSESNVEIISHEYKTNNPLIHLDRNDEKGSSGIRPDKAIYFNENKFIDPITHKEISDTSGELKGSVYFAQNSIIPAVNRIEGDIQPTLVPNRKTLIMFKPQHKIPDNEDVYIEITDSKGTGSYIKKLSPPSKLPQLSYLSIYETNLRPRDFKKPSFFDLEVRNVNQLNKVLESPNYFNQLISKADNIKFNFSGIKYDNWTKPIHLNSNPKYRGKNIVFYNSTNSNIIIRYSNKYHTIEQNHSIQFICDNSGRWLTKPETKKLKELSVSKKIPKTFDYELHNKDKIESYDIALPLLLKRYSSIKINIHDNSDVKKIKLTNNKQYESKIIQFSSESMEKKKINFNNKEITLKKGDFLYFVCDKKGIWRKLSINTDASKLSLGKSFEYDEVINEKEKLEQMQENTQFMENLLLRNQRQIRIDINDENWVDSIKLPNGNRYCYITFNTTASKNTKIHINGTYLELKKGEHLNLDFVTTTKKWRNNPLIVLPEHMNNLEYMENTWSTTIPGEYIQPNIKIDFIHKNKMGILPKTTIGAPTMLRLHLLDIGIFTEPRDKFDFRDTPELNRQYYQQIPASILLVNRYESTRVDQFVFGDGTILKEVIPENGGWHEESISKITRWAYGEGIHMATSGINSSPDDGPTFVPTPQIVVYNSVGQYQNGRVIHGGMGSYTGGLASVEDSIGNEFSHELGHNFDIIDFYGGHTELGIHRPSHQKNSTWGWDADNNMFIPNFERSGIADHDAMNGGSPKDESNNAYSLYTPNTLAAIQQRLEKLHAFNSDSSTGYQKWNSETSKMEDAYLELPSFLQFNVPVKNGEDISLYKLCKALEKYDVLKIKLGNDYHSKNIHLPDASSRNAEDTIIIETCTDWDTTVHLNGETEKIKKNEKITYISDGKSWVKSHLHGLHKKPIKQDVPVITVLGFYDPEGQILVTDPEKQKSNHVQDILYGSSGMVYKDNKKLDSCSSYLEFDLEDGTTRQYKLHGTNFRTSHMNRFHVNIERDLKPVKVKIFIKGELKESKDIEIRELKLPTTINGLTI
ncbi:M66 family metalloprotease [Providencia rettgeri]|uniref:M66 family metalloprotease n=1 Tax=Providencia rettgeri TaxID=587 RepID=UPI0022701BB6|nr:M66 family metalloprotease [Providencia rettgeri]MCX9118298.1 M66 family metalloprotease [Providencia rettgeri]